MIEKLKSYFWMALAIAALAGLVTQSVRLHSAQLSEAEAVVALATDRATAADQLALGQEKNRTIEFNLHTDAAGITKVTNVAVQALSSQRDDLLQRVRVAESNVAAAKLVSKASAASSARAVAPGGDGAELLGSIGSADVGEASRADTIRLHLVACYAKYEKARLSLSQ